jgi:hypothetical protein
MQESICMPLQEPISWQSILILVILLSIFAFCAGFICSNEIVIRRASGRQGYRTNRGTIIKVAEE